MLDSCRFSRLRLGVTIALLISITGGCGFHLRKPQPLPFQAVYLKMSGCPSIKQAFKAHLIQHRCQVFDAPAAESASGAESVPERVRLDVQCPVLETQPLVYDGKGQLRRQRLHYTLQGTLAKDTQTHAALASTTREQQLNYNQTLADAAETEMLLQEMQASLFQQITAQLSRLQLSGQPNHANQ